MWETEDIPYDKIPNLLRKTDELLRGQDVDEVRRVFDHEYLIFCLKDRISTLIAVIIGWASAYIIYTEMHYLFPTLTMKTTSEAGAGGLALLTILSLASARAYYRNHKDWDTAEEFLRKYRAKLVEVKKNRSVL